MRIVRAVAGLLLLLALLLGVQAGNRCSNCGLGEGDDPCACGNTAVRAQKISKPDIFASPEAIKEVLNFKSMYGAPSPSPVSYSLSSTSNLKNKNLLRLTPITSIAPKFEPIGDLCHTCKGYKDNVVGVIPARPPKLPCKCSKSKSEAKTTATTATIPLYPTSAPLPIYGAAPSYNAPSLSVPVPQTAQVPAHYSSPIPSYSPPASAAFYNYPTVPAYQYAPAYQAPVPPAYSPPPTTCIAAQYNPGYQQPSPIIHVASAPSPAKRSYKETSAGEPNLSTKRTHKKSQPQPIYDKVTREARYDSACHQQYAPIMTAVESYIAAKQQVDYDKGAHEVQYNPAYQQQLASAVYEVGSSQCDCKGKQGATNNLALTQYSSTHQEPPSVAHAATPTNDEREAETYVEIVLQQEQAPKYTADPISISLAYKNLAESQGKKHVAEDSLAYGHDKEPVDGRVCKHISNFDEEKLHTVDKPVVELKGRNADNLQVSYSDIGYGPVAPSQNRFVPKSDTASNTPSIIHYPPFKDEGGILGEPLGPTVPGYKSGGIIVSKSKNGKASCGKESTVQEGSRQGVLVEESEEYDNDDSYNGKAGIIERIKSTACKPGF